MGGLGVAALRSACESSRSRKRSSWLSGGKAHQHHDDRRQSAWKASPIEPGSAQRLQYLGNCVERWLAKRSANWMDGAAEGAAILREWRTVATCAGGNFHSACFSRQARRERKSATGINSASLKT